MQTQLQELGVQNQTTWNVQDDVRLRWVCHADSHVSRGRLLQHRIRKYNTQITYLILHIILRIMELKLEFLFSGKLQKHRVELVKKFYLTLVDILNDKIACRDYCEVILFNGNN